MKTALVQDYNVSLSGGGDRVVILFQLVTIIMMVYLMEIRLIVIVSVLTHRGKKVGFHSVRTWPTH